MKYIMIGGLKIIQDNTLLIRVAYHGMKVCNMEAYDRPLGHMV